MDEDDLLLKIYIGQRINYLSGGILYKFKDKFYFNEKERKTIEILKNKNLIEIICPYSVKSISSILTTKNGTELASNMIKGLLVKDSTLLKELEIIPKKVLGFILINSDDLTFEKNKSEWALDWKDFIFNSKIILDFSIEFCRILEKHRLAISTNDYVSTKGGRVDPEKYVIPYEIKDYLINRLKLTPFDPQETNKSILLYSIYEIKGIIDIRDNARRRNNLWNLLQVLPFHESVIKHMINKFKEENITSEYSEINNEKFLFTIFDDTRFDIKLNQLVDNFIQELIQGGKVDYDIPLPKYETLLRMHSELFILIGEFETQLRNYIVNEMRVALKAEKDEWYEKLREIKFPDSYQFPYKTLYEKLELRKNEDIKDGKLPENELIFYADISDYANVFLKNWEIFETKLNKINLSKEKFLHGMDQLNNIRKKVMHLRQIMPNEDKTIKLYILPELERIFK